MEADSNPVVQRLLRKGGQERVNHQWNGIQAAHAVLLEFHSRYSNNTLEIGSGEAPCYVFRPGKISSPVNAGCSPAGATAPIGDWTREEKYVLDKIRQIAGHFIVTKNGGNILLHLPGNPWVRGHKTTQDDARVYSVVCVREANLRNDDNLPAGAYQKDDKTEMKNAGKAAKPPSQAGGGPSAGPPAAPPVVPGKAPDPDDKPKDSGGASKPPEPSSRATATPL